MQSGDLAMGLRETFRALVDALSAPPQRDSSDFVQRLTVLEERGRIAEQAADASYRHMTASVPTEDTPSRRQMRLMSDEIQRLLEGLSVEDLIDD